MTIRVLVALFSGVIAFITFCLIPVSYFGDKNEPWTKRLMIISFFSASVFMIDMFWGI
ncbi:MAG TPA: hypothetical protein VGS27_17310 [Candidatus Sulfotelmatobacter sp.]|nr:hypothetical protein [Candidatus Sulfotelmatobacter sp.]